MAAESDSAVAPTQKRKEKDTGGDERYYYMDFTGAVMGPFPLSRMLAWWNAGHLSEELPVRKESDAEDDYRTIKEIPETFPPRVPSNPATATVAAAADADADVQPPAKKSKNEAEVEQREDNDATATTDGDSEESVKGTAGTRAYFYKDAVGETFGPFTPEQMTAWTKAGYFTAEMLVAETGAASESEFKALAQHAELLAALPRVNTSEATEQQQQQQQQIAAVAFAQQWGQRCLEVEERVVNGQPMTEYAVKGSFNALTGKFQALSNQEYWARRSLPSDGAGRQIHRYMDIDAYQEERRRKQYLLENGLARPNVKKPKGPKKKKALYSP